MAVRMGRGYEGTGSLHGHRVAPADGSRHHHPGTDPSEVHGLADLGLEEVECVQAEPPRELGAAGVGLVGHLDNRPTDPDPRPGRKVVGPEGEVHGQLVPGQRHAFGITGDEGEKPAVDDVELHVGVWSTVFCPVAGPLTPVVAHQPVLDGQRGGLQHLTLLGYRPTDDQLQGALGGWRPTDLVDAGLELRGGPVFHQLILANGGSVSPPGYATLGTG